MGSLTKKMSLLNTRNLNAYKTVQRSPTGRALLGFLCFYIVLIVYCQKHYQHDPGSKFFDPRTAYEPRYTVQRQDEANTFMHEAIDRLSTNKGNVPFKASSANKTMCVGITSLRRPTEQYLPTTIGSILSGLTAEERASMHLVVFIAHLDPGDHPSFSEPWLDALTDEVLIYNLKYLESVRLRQLEQERNFVAKGVFDYQYLLDACHKTGAPYIAILEDDVTAMSSWYPRTLAALNDAEKLTHEKGELDWLYLRLFYSEEFLGWNSEEWPTYLWYSILITIVPVLCLLALRVSFPGRLQKILSNRAIGATFFICMPALIVLYFFAGKMSMQPLSPGVQEMNNHGSCSQGYVYQRDMIPRVIDWLESKVGFVDLLVEEFGTEGGLTRWATVPPLLQHTGRTSSKGGDYGEGSKWGMTIAEKVWSFEFENWRESVNTSI
jgi:N-Acetylglucosaminyltransferase-IV (GnT-IV) conserved region